MPDALLRQSAVMNGEVDLVDRVDPRSVAPLSQSSGVDIFETPGTSTYGFPLPTSGVFRAAVLL